MEPFTILRARIVPLVRDDIDTDQIIPARFLKVTDKHGLGAQLFSDWRYQDGGSPRPDFVLNQPDYQAAQVLLAGHNFGCGSSREHAPWALMDWGFRVVIATSFADIFRNNALKNGLLPVAIEPLVHARLCALVSETPGAEVTVDLAQQTVELPDGKRVGFPVDPFARRCLMAGTDQLGYLLSQAGRIDAFERAGGGQGA
jgi:3-isopropylmalate/(R)-2-methylmalate dehydratase small subunit